MIRATHDYIAQPRPPLSDEAASEILDFLYDFITDFECAYADQIRRHYQNCTPDHTIDPVNPAVPDSNDPPF
jgi:hypothetical protein